MAATQAVCRFGLPQWQHSDWYASSLSSLAALGQYVQYMQTVEGNHTFYAPPTREQVMRWAAAVPGDFRFCFKFPQAISHRAQLRHCQQDVSTFLHALAPLGDSIGVIWLQLSAAFDAHALPQLADFVATLPRDFHYGVEIRHLDFFDKGEHERRFNRLLMQHNINRVMFDTSQLFALPADDPATHEALLAKPRVPTHVLATGQRPMLRFIAPLDWRQAEASLDRWASKLQQWLQQGLEPLVFLHTPDNRAAPQLATALSASLCRHQPTHPPLPTWPTAQPQTQQALF